MVVLGLREATQGEVLGITKYRENIMQSVRTPTSQWPLGILSYRSETDLCIP